MQNLHRFTRLNRIVAMFIDYAELMAEDEVLMSMADWLKETDNFLANNRQKILDGKGCVSHEEAAKKAEGAYRCKVFVTFLPAVYDIREEKESINEDERKEAFSLAPAA